MQIVYLHIIVLFTLSASVMSAQNIPDPMSPPRFVNDFAGVFSSNECNQLEQVLRSYHDSTSTQIYIVVVDNLQGYPPSEYAYQVGEKWKIGQKGKDNGAIILIKPKKNNSPGQTFIATGYGLEEKLTDARCGRIIDKEMLPHFRTEDYYSGTLLGVQSMIEYLSGTFSSEQDPEEENSNLSKNSKEILEVLMVIGFLYILYLIHKNNNKNKNNRHNNPGGGTPFFPPTIFKGGYGSSGPRFGGGGGGRFGGGGAGRSW